jgi:acyl carrier protein
LVKEIIVEQLSVSDEEVVPEASFVDDRADSLTLLSSLWSLKKSLAKKSRMKQQKNQTAGCN